MTEREAALKAFAEFMSGQRPYIDTTIPRVCKDCGRNECQAEVHRCTDDKTKYLCNDCARKQELVLRSETTYSVLRERRCIHAGVVGRCVICEAESRWWRHLWRRLWVRWVRFYRKSWL